jgi:hypothetical protein
LCQRTGKISNDQKFGNKFWAGFARVGVDFDWGVVGDCDLVFEDKKLASGINYVGRRFKLVGEVAMGVCD